MCFDHSNCQGVDYPKHLVPLAVRDPTPTEIDALTANRDSLYYRHVNHKVIELAVLKEGTYVRTKKAATIQKIMAFDLPIGASEGRPSKWVMVEVTSGVYHGRPTTEEWFLRRLKRRAECCRGE